MNNVSRTLLWAVGIPIGSVLFMLVIGYIAALPTVHYSISKNECVNVLESDGSEHLCTENLDTRKYDPVWVP